MSIRKISSGVPLNIALIQMQPVPLQPEQNFSLAATHIKSAAIAGASLAVLPEYHLTGYVPEDPCFSQIACESYQYVERYCSLAREFSIHIVPGTIVLREEHDVLLNRTYFISSAGEILGSYTKINLWHPERAHLTPGCGCSLDPNEAGGLPEAHHQIIETPIGPIGLLICYDLAFPEAFRELAKAGARIIIIPTFTKSDDMSIAARGYNPGGEELFTRSALISRAFENTCCIVFCNVGGPQENGFVGLSQVVLPIVGPVLGSFEDAREGMNIVATDMSAVDVAEENYKIRMDLAMENYHYR